MIDRRAFVLTAGAAATLVARTTWAQATRVPRVALIAPADLSTEMVEGGHPYWGALLGGLRELGYIEDETVAIERWSGRGMTSEDYAELSQRVAGTSPDVIVVRSADTIECARSATSTIPIVGLGTFPADLRPRLARPGGNTTGISATLGAAVQGKMVQFLHDAIPSAARIAWLGARSGRLSWQHGQGAKVARASAEQLGLTLIPTLWDAPANEAKLRTAIASMADQNIHAVLFSGTTQHFTFRDFLAEQMLAARLPAIGLQLEHARAGQLLSYAPDFAVSYRRLATHVDRILKGADPGELPIEQPTEIKLVVNLKTARALGITIPSKLLIRAAEIIE